MDRPTTGIIVMVLLVAVGVLGVMLYQERQKASGVEISVGDGKLEIEKK